MSRLNVERALLALCALVGLAAANEMERRPPIKIGVVKSLLRNPQPKLFQVVASAFGAVMHAQTGLYGELQPHESAEDVRRKLLSGELQLGVMYGVEYGWMKNKQPDLMPLMLNEIDPDSLEAVVVTRHADGLKRLNDCRGKSLAVPATIRADSRLFLTQRCRHCGFGMPEMFQTTTSPDSVEEALDSVVDGVVQVAMVERSGMKMFERRKPARYRQLVVVEQSEIFPPSVIVYMRGKIDDATLNTFRHGMSTAHKSTLGAHLMSLMNIRKFAPIPKEFQKGVEDIVKKYPAPVEAPTAQSEVTGN